MGSAINHHYFMGNGVADVGYVEFNGKLKY